MGGGSNNDSEIKKGPWTAEEDEILLKFVNKYGPRDWSSIRSKGLLPRTGKSCRLRWVNKLRPNLKVGCKFTAEEERMVVDMQARFGNKWATIATYLPGRTDNDVKNFWSTRQKRLARILQSSSSSQQHKPPLKSKGKLPLVHHQASASPLQVSMVGGGDCNQVKEEASSSYNNQQPQSSSLSYLQNNEIIMAAINPQPLVINDPSTQELLFTQLPQHPKLDHSFLLENQDLVSGFVGEPSGSGLDFFPHQNACGHLENVAPFCYGSPAFGFDSGGGSSHGGGGGGSGGGVGQGDIGNLANPEILFDDFPAIVFDSLEPFPSSPEH